MIFFTNPNVFHLMHTDRYIEQDSVFLKSEFFKDVSMLIYVAFLSRLKLDRQSNLQNMSCKRQCLLRAVCVTRDVHICSALPSRYSIRVLEWRSFSVWGLFAYGCTNVNFTACFQDLLEDFSFFQVTDLEKWR